MVARFDFLPKLLWGIGRDVDLSSQPRLRLAERRRQVSKTCSANDHHIHVTHRMFPASCHGTIDKSTLNIVSKPLKARRARAQAAGEFRKIPPLVWLAEGSRKHTLPYLWEQRSQHGRVTHIAYIITHIA